MLKLDNLKAAREKTGDTAFYKDGYTDVRGKFDYVSVSTGQLEGVEAFARLVKHDNLGAVIVTVKPPLTSKLLKAFSNWPYYV